jgi:hypothetical protein
LTVMLFGLCVRPSVTVRQLLFWVLDIRIEVYRELDNLLPTFSDLDSLLVVVGTGQSIGCGWYWTVY